MSRRETAGRRIRVRSTRPAVKIGPAVLLSLCLLLVGWTLLWFLARHEAGVAFSRWIEAERTEGRVWTCPNERIGGYPLGIVVACDRPTFKGAIADGVFEGDMAGLTVEARLYFPTNVTVTLASPLQAHEVDGDRTLRVTWSAAMLLLRGALPGGLDRGNLQADDVVLGAMNGAAAAANRVGHVEIGFKPIDRSAEMRGDLEANITMTDAAFPALDESIGSRDLVNLTLKGFATQVAFDGAATLEGVLDPWTRAGGQVHLQSFELRKGSFQAAGAGRIGLDAEHRIEGRLDARFSGLEPIAARFGIPVGAVKVGGILSGLLGGGKSQDVDAEPADMAFPITAKDGRVFVGPVKTGVALAPLY